MTKPKKILLVDDHSIIRMALTTIVNELYPGTIVDEASDGNSALSLIRDHEYCIVIMDINMPDTESYFLVKNMIREKPDLNILVFSMHPEELYARRLLKAGGMAYIRKNQPVNLIKKAITMVVKNQRYISEALGESLATEALEGNTTSHPFETLSRRELEILRHLIRGKSVGEISKNLSLHTSTIGTHKARIFTKLGVTNIVEIATLAKINDIDLEAL